MSYVDQLCFTFLLIPRAQSTSGPAGFRDSFVRRFYERLYLPRSSAVDVFCGPTRHHVALHRRRGCRAGATRVVPAAVVSGRERVQKAAGGALQVLSMGRLDTHKGIDTLLAAARRLAGRNDIHVHVAGTGRLEPAVRAAAREGEGVTYHGYVDGARRAGLLAEADVLVFGSHCLESFGLAIAEAFAAGAAVLVTDVGGQAELVADGQEGFHFAPGAAVTLAGLLARLADDPALLRTLQDGAWRARERYVPAGMVGAYREIYASLGGTRS